MVHGERDESYRRLRPRVALGLRRCCDGWMHGGSELRAAQRGSAAAYKETPQNFKEAQPSDQIAKGKWWEIYDDPQLNDLEEQIVVSNQTLKAEQAQFAAARAAVRIARSQSFPT